MVNLVFAVAVNYLRAVQLFIRGGGGLLGNMMLFNLTTYAFHASKISQFTVKIQSQLLKLPLIWESWNQLLENM